MIKDPTSLILPSILSKLGLVRKPIMTENKVYLIRLKIYGWLSLLSLVKIYNPSWLFTWSYDMFLHSWGVCTFCHLPAVGLKNFYYSGTNLPEFT